MSNIIDQPKDYQILFLDMNSFFASVEQQVQPTLRGIPLGVAPYTGDSGCIIAASYEAKQMGIKICRVGEAKKIYPKIKILEARPALYMLYHKEIRKVIEKFTPFYQALSIDEFAIRLSPSDQNHSLSMEMALGLKAAIRAEVGDYLKCSIGIGPSIFLAKMAGEQHKPDGLTTIKLAELKEFYAQLENMRDLTGINFRLEDRLKNFNIGSPTDFFNLSLSRLREILNHWGRLWYYRLRGYEVDDYVIKTKTIGHSHVLPPEFRSKEGAIAVLKKIIYKTGFRLRKEGYFAAGVAVSIHFLDRGNFSLSRRVPSFCDSRSLTMITLEMLKNCRWQSRPIYVSISTFNLSKVGGEQISIFSDIEKSKGISRAIDLINDDFGAGTIFPASMYEARETAPDRIPFGSPRYDILH